MSLPEIRGAGRLITDPKTGPTRSGGTWTNGLVLFQAWKRDGDGWTQGDSITASVIGFDDVAEALAGYAKGDEIAVQGTASVGLWKDQPQLKITLSKVWTPERQRRERTARTADSARPADRPVPDQRRRQGDLQPAAAPPRRGSAIVANLQDHVARRRAGQLSAGRPA